MPLLTAAPFPLLYGCLTTTAPAAAARSAVASRRTVVDDDDLAPRPGGGEIGDDLGDPGGFVEGGNDH